MSIYAIGDLHLSQDERIDKPMDVFGKEWEDHPDKVKQNWEQKITDDDTVIVAGDISWGLKLDEAMADLAWVHALPGKKVCIKGNHDLWWNAIGKINALFDDIIFLQNTAYETEDVCICGTRGWVCPGSDSFSAEDEKIYKREVLRLENSLREGQKTGKEIIGVLHYPPTNDKKQLSGFTELFEKYFVKQVVYGHLHAADAARNREAFNINGVTYKLVSLDGLKADPIKLR